MATATHDLIIRLDESGEKFLFFTMKKMAKRINQEKNDEPVFSVEISLEELKSRGVAGAESLIGESILGFFDHLTNGQLDLPKHYRDE